MKKLIVLFSLIILAVVALAQGTMSVKSFKELANDLDALDAKYEKMDFNGERAAIIKIVTNEKGFTFDVGSVGVVASVQHVGEVWVYVPHSVQRITIKHPYLGILRDYYFPTQIEKARVYELVLHSGSVTQVVNQDAGGQYVILDIEPKVVGVSVAGGDAEYITDGYFEKFLPYGEHSFVVSSSMYKTLETIINVSSEKVEKKIELEPNFGSVRIDANVSGAEVYIDDVPKGSTPYILDRLAFGSYRVMVFKDDYVAERFTLNIDEARTYERDVVLQKNTAQVNISCALNGATIYVGDKAIGIAPCRTELTTGTHKIEARKEGHRATLLTITVQRGINQAVQIDAPQPKYGKLNASSSQRGVEVYVDGVKLGTTPNIFSNILEGRRKVVFKKEGFEDNEQIVEVKEGSVFSVRGDMEVWRPKTADQIYTVKGVSFKMVFVEGGTFSMGSNVYSEEKPVHSVTLSNYYIGETEVTQELWKAVMGKEPSYFEGDRLPVESVAWKDCIRFIDKLNRLLENQLPKGAKFTLPTEAQWEYAARGGNQTQGYTYSGSNTVGDVAWYSSNSNNAPHAVGTKAANELGIYDMSGNVWEWCADWYDSNYSKIRFINNPQGPSLGLYRILRGGSWFDGADNCRVANRYGEDSAYSDYFCGFRLSLSYNF